MSLDKLIEEIELERRVLVGARDKTPEDDSYDRGCRLGFLMGIQSIDRLLKQARELRDRAAEPVDECPTGIFLQRQAT